VRSLENRKERKMTNQTRCEGWRRSGGAFTFGPVVWKQCEEAAVVFLTVTQNDQNQSLPACLTCWQEAIDNNISVLEAKPLRQKTRLSDESR